MQEILHVALGSTSPLKVEALKEALNTLSIKSKIFVTKSLSGQNDQPVGFDETYSGALARALKAERKFPDSIDSIAIGIENGIFRFAGNTTTIECAVIVVLTPGGRHIVTTSAGILFPEEYVRKAKERGFKTVTVGQVISKELGGDHADPHSALTKGKITRKEILVNALIIALKQI